MFNVPNFYEMPNMTFEEAKGILTIDGDLPGMEHILLCGTNMLLAVLKTCMPMMMSFLTAGYTN